jgi:S-DNA-T family DNA segregation ATPase FtsK/SpoIIIE
LERIVTHWKAQIMPPEGHVPESIDPQHTVQKPLWPEMPNGTGPSMEDNGDDDTLLPDAIDLIRRHQKASVSFLQRGLRIGYSRAARMIDSLEEQGIIGPATGTSKARDVLIPAPGDAQPVMETEEEGS